MNKLFILTLTIIIFQSAYEQASAHSTVHEGGDRISLSYLSSFHSGVYKEGGAEIVSFDPTTQLAFVTNGFNRRIDAVSLTKPESPFLRFSIDLKNYGFPNSVAVKNDLVAVAIENENPQAVGSIVVFNTKGEFLNQFKAGAMPDMVTFTPDAKHILAANEGEPNDAYTIDPEGSITIIDLLDDVTKLTQKNVRTADFNAFKKETIDPKIRISGKNASVAQDLEPEYISITADSKTAWVSLQENNALAKVNIDLGRVEQLYSLGTLSHNNAQNAIDASDKDNGINIKAWPVEGLFQPDSIATFTTEGGVYIVTANEGDSRDYQGHKDHQRVSTLTLDPRFSKALHDNDKLGRLHVSTFGADSNNDGLVDRLLSFGTRSFSIWNSEVVRVYDSGSQFAQITARDYPRLFNANDKRSDNKGSEPEALTVGKIGKSTFAFIGLERTGGIMVYNISKPKNAFFVDYVNNISPQLAPNDPNAGDQAPESIAFVSAKDSPNGRAFIITANEISGTVSIYQVNQAQARHH